MSTVTPPAPKTITIEGNTLDLKQLKKLLGDQNATPFEIQGELTELRDRRMNRLASRTSKIGSITEDGEFISTKGDSLGISHSVERAEELADYVKDMEPGGAGHKAMLKLQETDKKALSKRSGHVFKQLDKLEKHNSELVAAATAHEGKVLAELEKEHAKNIDALRKEHQDAIKKLGRNPDADLIKLANEENLEKMKKLASNRSEVIDAVKVEFKDLRDGYHEQIKEAKDLTSRLEKATGLKAADHLHVNSSVVAATEKGAAKEAEAAVKSGVFSRMGQNISKGGFMGMAKVGLGVIAGGGLAISGFNDLAGRTDEQGKPVETSKFVGLLKVAGGLVGGAMLAGHRR